MKNYLIIFGIAIALLPKLHAADEDLRKQVEELSKTVKKQQEQIDRQKDQLNKQQETLADHGIKTKSSTDLKNNPEWQAMKKDVSEALGATKQNRPSVFNPSISAAVDFVSGYSDLTGVDFAVRDAEVTIDSNVDQFAYAYAVFNASTELDLEERTGVFRRNAEGTRLGLEEAAIQTTSLPYGLTLKGGQFFADFTRMGKVHPHDRPFVDGPRSVDSIIGGEAQARGFEATWLTPLSQYTRLTFGVIDGIGSEPPNTVALTLPDGSTRTAFDTTGHRSFDDLTYYVRSATVFELPKNVNLHLGLDYASNFHDVKRQIASADLKIDWKPFANRFDRFTWGTEALWQRQTGRLPIDSFLPSAVPFTALDHADAIGGYTYAQYRFGKYWEPGVRFDITAPESFEMRDMDGDGNANDLVTVRDTFYTYSGYLSAYPSEFQRLRFQFSYIDVANDPLRAGGNTNGTKSEFQVWLQWTITLGAHKHPFMP